jgi:hypothetical protein
VLQLGEVMNARQGGQMSADEASSKITAGMKGMYARRQVRSAPILSVTVDSSLPLRANKMCEKHCRQL